MLANGECMQTDRKIKILVVDDSDNIRRMVRTVLRQLGFAEIGEASDGLQALSKLKTGAYDLLISDWNMPNLDGISLLRMIRGDADLKDLKVLMVTAEAEKGHVIEAIKAGINDYVVKPFSADILEKKIEKIFGAGPPPEKPS
jgi:two-component system chemotaxis response regulator CheY